MVRKLLGQALAAWSCGGFFCAVPEKKRLGGIFLLIVDIRKMKGNLRR